MTGFHTSLEEDTTENDNFRKVIYTAPHSQLVLMSLLPNEEIGMETHKKSDQFFRIEYGVGEAVLNGEKVSFKAGDCIVVPAGTQHNIINTSSTEKIKLYTIYSPRKHPNGTINITKQIEKQKGGETK